MVSTKVRGRLQTETTEARFTSMTGAMGDTMYGKQEKQ